MARPRSNSNSPLVKPTAPVLIGLSVLTLGAGIFLLLWGDTDQYRTAAFFLLSLFAATVTVGFLGATGKFKSRTTQLGGSAAVFAVLFGLLMQFQTGQSIREIKGTLFLDGNVVTNATVALLESDRVGNVQQIGAQDNGHFRFAIEDARQSYKLRIQIPDLGETVVTQRATPGWLQVDLQRAQFRPSTQPQAWVERCKPDKGTCTLFVFDYLNDSIAGGELEAFHNFQTDRLDKGLRNYLESRNLLENMDFRVKRCAALQVSRSSMAKEAAEALNVSAVAWGFIRRKQDKLMSGTTFTVADERAIDVMAREELGDDITELIAFARPLQNTPLALATLLIGDAYVQQGNALLAKRAFLHAKELAAQIEPPDRDLLRAIETRLHRLPSTATVRIAPLGGEEG